MEHIKTAMAKKIIGEIVLADNPGEILKKWRKNPPNSTEIFNFEKEICKQVYESLQKNFPMIQMYNER